MKNRSLLAIFVATLSLLVSSVPAFGSTSDYAVGPQYVTTHVYVRPADFDRFVASFVATFGGTTTPKGTFTVTPTASKTMSQLALTPSGVISVFGFITPIPFPFGAEHYGYLVTSLLSATASARTDGATVMVLAFNDPVGSDVIVQWPGGLAMQLYQHTTPPNYPALRYVPESRVYVSPDSANPFIRGFVAFSHGRIVSDVPNAPGIEIGLANKVYRRIEIESAFGNMRVIVTDGHLPYPYGRELTGYEVANLGDTLRKATSTGAAILVQPFLSDRRVSAVVQFPGGYVAEIHAVAQ
jgi:hypothetical protein